MGPPRRSLSVGGGVDRGGRRGRLAGPLQRVAVGASLLLGVPIEHRMRLSGCAWPATLVTTATTGQAHTVCCDPLPPRTVLCCVITSEDVRDGSAWSPLLSSRSRVKPVAVLAPGPFSPPALSAQLTCIHLGRTHRRGLIDRAPHTVPSPSPCQHGL